MASRKKKTLIGGGIAFGVLVGISAITSAFEEEPVTAAPAATTTTTTAPATEAPTEEPTEAPTQEPTPAPDKTKAEWALAMAPRVSKLVGAMEAIVSITSQADATKIYDEAWMASLLVELATMRMEAEAMAALDAPPEYAAFEAKFDEAMSYYVLAADEMSSGLRNVDVTAVTTGAGLLARGTALMAEANALLP